jgi:CRISPR/Cas system CSM-associated protein Csm3 (group 7 of RAMP superfamily)
MSFGNRDRGGAQQPPLPKPYDFVPLPQERIRLDAPAGHDRIQPNLLHGIFTATLVARSPIHVASGLLEPRNDRDNRLVKAHFRTAGQPAIPGISLKGCIRSIAEALSPSAVHVTKERDLPREYQPNRTVDRLDVIQHIFGAQGYQGQISFSDAVLERGETTTLRSVQLFRPRTDAKSAYFDGRRPKGRKFYMHGTPAVGDLPLEVCPVGSHFRLTMHFQNLAPGEVGLLLFAMGLGEPHFCPKLGGAKPACLGTIEVTEARLQFSNVTERYTSFEDVAPADAEFAPLLTEARVRGLVLGEQLDALATILRWPNDERSCPDRNY